MTGNVRPRIRQLVVSVASHPPRFHMLKTALNSIMSQTRKPDIVVLWLAPEERDHLPEDVAFMRGLTIGICDNLRSYKKLVPARQTYPDAHILTGDDDQLYPPTWVQSFVDAHTSDSEILLMRGKRILRDDKGGPAAYDTWPKVPVGSTSPALFPTSVRGMLVPPRAFGDEFFDMHRARLLAPNNDDIWWFWMARRAGLTFRLIGGDPITNLPTHKDGLYRNFNSKGGNDRQIFAMASVYGWPE